MSRRVDVGERRVGLAISDASRTLARPLETIDGHRARRMPSSASRSAIDELSAEDDGLDDDRRRAAVAARRIADAADAARAGVHRRAADADARCRSSPKASG